VQRKVKQEQSLLLCSTNPDRKNSMLNLVSFTLPSKVGHGVFNAAFLLTYFAEYNPFITYQFAAGCVHVRDITFVIVLLTRFIVSHRMKT